MSMKGKRKDDVELGNEGDEEKRQNSGADNPGFVGDDAGGGKEHGKGHNGRRLSSSSDDASSDEGGGRIEDKELEPRLVGEAVLRLRAPVRYLRRHRAAARTGLWVLLALLYNAFLVAAIYYGVADDEGGDGGLDYCHDVGFLVILTVVVYAGLLYFGVVKRFFGKAVQRALFKPAQQVTDRLFQYKWASGLVYSVGREIVPRHEQQSWALSVFFIFSLTKKDFLHFLSS